MTEMSRQRAHRQKEIDELANALSDIVAQRLPIEKGTVFHAAFWLLCKVVSSYDDPKRMAAIAAEGLTNHFAASSSPRAPTAVEVTAPTALEPPKPKSRPGVSVEVRPMTMAARGATDVTNDEIIEVAKEANRIVRALNEEKGDHDALAIRLRQIMGRVSYPEHPLLRLAMNMLEGKPFGAYDDDPETMRRLDSLAADIGARKKAWTVLGSPGALYEPPLSDLLDTIQHLEACGVDLYT